MVAGRGGVADRPEPDRLVISHQPLLAQRQGMRLVRQRVQHLPLGGKPRGRDRGGLPVHPPVDPVAELAARLGQLGEAAVSRQQVRIRGHQVGLGDLHRGLDPALGLRVERDARLHLAAVVAAHGDHLRVPHRDPGHVVHGDRPGVIGQQVGRRPAHRPQCLVDAPGQRPELLVPGRDDHPEPGPGQPCREQLRPPGPDRRPVAPVPLQPHPRLGHPRPVTAAPARLPGFLHLRDRPASGPLRPPVAHRRDLPVRHIRPDLALAPVDQLFDLRHERIDQPRPDGPGQRIPARLPGRNIPGNRLRVAPGQLRRRPGRPGEVERLENLHDLPARLGHGSLRTPMGKANHLKPIHTGGTTSITTRHKPARELAANLDPDGRETGETMAANLELTDRTPAFFRGR